MRLRQKRHFVIVPVLLENCRVPLFLKDYLYIPFTSNRIYQESLGRLCDSFIFREEFLSRYRSAYSGAFIVDRVSIRVNIEGGEQELATFREDYAITPIKVTDQISKQFAHDGEIEEVFLSSGRVVRTTIGKSTESWLLKFNEGLRPRESRSFFLTYRLRHEFQVAKRWFYSFDSPTRLFEFDFIFARDCAPSVLKVKFMQTQTPTCERVLKGKATRKEVVYHFTQPFPSYKDWFEFTWG
jgi:hypothetical protein